MTPLGYAYICIISKLILIVQLSCLIHHAILARVILAILAHGVLAVLAHVVLTHHSLTVGHFSLYL